MSSNLTFFWLNMATKRPRTKTRRYQQWVPVNPSPLPPYTPSLCESWLYHLCFFQVAGGRKMLHVVHLQILVILSVLQFDMGNLESNMNLLFPLQTKGIDLSPLKVFLLSSSNMFIWLPMPTLNFYDIQWPTKLLQRTNNGHP